MKPEIEKKFEEQNHVFEKMFAILSIPFVVITGYFLIFHYL